MGSFGMLSGSNRLIRFDAFESIASRALAVMWHEYLASIRSLLRDDRVDSMNFTLLVSKNNTSPRLVDLMDTNMPLLMDSNMVP